MLRRAISRAKSGRSGPRPRAIKISMERTKKASGFTLVEVIVAMSIFVVLMAGVVWFGLQNLKGFTASERRMTISAQVKKFTNELIIQGSRSNQFVLYKSITATDFDAATDRQTIPAT